MDSSSEGSFAWTDASNDSTDNETMAKSNHNTNNSGEDSESGKTFKKKLRQRLFSKGGEEEIASEPSEPRKRKLSQRHSDADNLQSPEEKRVKAEPESDVDLPKQKKKKSLESKCQDTSYDLYDESFLNSKVKSEECFAIPSPIKVKKNKKKSVSGANDTCMSNGDVKEPEMDSKGFSNSQITFEDSSTPGSSHAEEEGENESNIIKAKKNKKKTVKKFNSSKDNAHNGAEEESLLVEEVSIPTKHISTSADESDSSAGTPPHVEHNTTTNNESKNNQKTISNRDNTLNHTTVPINSDSLVGKRKSRMSERIQFEDEDDSDVRTNSNTIKTPAKSTDSKKLTSFIEESSITLRPFQRQLPSALILTDEDDVWTIRCPKDVELKAFQDKKWVLDSKCKIKLDGQSYEGDICDTKCNMTVLSSEKKREVIKNITINGCIRLRRRLPKAHIHEDNVMVNNQTNFIPLPDTKCRHPLFGFHYKRAMRLPSGVAERLRTPRVFSSANRRKKRDELDSPATLKMELAPACAPRDRDLTHSTITPKKKKKKKRKHSDAAEDEEAPPPPKRSKRVLDSAEAWDSEKAIEENLFNF